ncbi:MAG: hypothetical protein KME27_23125 [Lyngbya sp. HA4199-MV5]|jgi:hypothetical protein|nr:hypothetical protein [Lyngbya sp. HA4199-MV5]
MKHQSAFPVHLHDTHGGLEGGLTKREYFAAKAVQGLLAGGRWEFIRPDNYWEWQGEPPKAIAEQAVEIADALIAELSK